MDIAKRAFKLNYKLNPLDPIFFADNLYDVREILEGQADDGVVGVEGNIDFYDRVFAPLIIDYLDMKNKKIPYNPDKGDVFISFYTKLIKSLKNRLKKPKGNKKP